MTLCSASGSRSTLIRSGLQALEHRRRTCGRSGAGHGLYGLAQARGWPVPILADSGNGGHGLYRIDLPNDDASRTLLKTCLEVLALYFTDSVVSLDVGVFNAARILKVYGTLACKGDHLPERPHRLSQLLDVPAPLVCVTRAQLGPWRRSSPRHRGHPDGVPRPAQTFDLHAWIATHGVPVVAEGPWQHGGYRWVLSPCPWNNAHTNASAFIVQLPNGAWRRMSSQRLPGQRLARPAGSR